MNHSSIHQREYRFEPKVTRNWYLCPESIHPSAQFGKANIVKRDALDSHTLIVNATEAVAILG
jgi:hypothetical protein